MIIYTDSNLDRFFYKANFPGKYLQVTFSYQTALQ